MDQPPRPGSGQAVPAPPPRDVADAREKFACPACGADANWNPTKQALICPFCGSDRTEWKPLSGRGTVYAFSTLRRTAQPYTVAYVKLEEGPTMLTNLVEIDDNDMRIGMPVRVAFRRTDEGRDAPIFTAEAAR